MPKAILNSIIVKKNESKTKIDFNNIHWTDIVYPILYLILLTIKQSFYKFCRINGIDHTWVVIKQRRPINR